MSCGSITFSSAIVKVLLIFGFSAVLVLFLELTKSCPVLAVRDNVESEDALENVRGLEIVVARVDVLREDEDVTLLVEADLVSAGLGDSEIIRDFKTSASSPEFVSTAVLSDTTESVGIEGVSDSEADDSVEIVDSSDADS